MFGFYSKVIFPRLYDCLMDKPFWAEHRQRQLAPVSGEILEIGIGTGLNLPHYPKHVRHITTVDPNPGMNKRLRRRITTTGIQVDQRLISSETLPFENAAFDFIVSTITLCSISDVHQAVRELFRVLRPTGSFVFLEHGICPDPTVARWQLRLNWCQRLIGDGCRLNVDIEKVLKSQPFSQVDIDNFFLEQTPRTHGYMYRGTAVK